MNKLNQLKTVKERFLELSDKVLNGELNVESLSIKASMSDDKKRLLLVEIELKE